MTQIKKRLAPYYRSSFRTSSMIEADIKLMKRVNTLFGKLEKTGKEIYVGEIVNTIKILNNVLYLHRILIILYEMVDIKYHKTLDVVLTSILEK